MDQIVHLCVYKQKVTCMYIPPIHLFYLPPISLPLSMSSEKSSFLFRPLRGDPQRWTSGTSHISRDCRQTKICKLVYQPIKILCTFVQIPNQYNIFTYSMWVSNGGSWCLTSSSSTTFSLSSCIKNIYMSMSKNKWVHEKHTCMYK